MTTEIARAQYLNGLDYEPVYWDKPKLVSNYSIETGKIIWAVYFEMIKADL